MRTFALILGTSCAFALIVSMSEKSFAQSAYGVNDVSNTHHVLTIRPHRTADSLLPMNDCDTIYCGQERTASYEVDEAASDPFSTCVKGCDIDTIYRAITGMPNVGWRR